MSEIRGGMTIRKVCRICQSPKLFHFLNLGETPLADAFVEREDEKKPEAKFPLDVAVCEECNLVQLVNIVDSKLLFSDHYAFYTSGSPAAVVHFREYAHSVADRFPDLAKQYCMEIASNDGVLLRAMKERGARVLGIEPSGNVAQAAQAAGIETIVKFFNKECAAEVAKLKGKAGLLLANNVVAHVDDLVDFMAGVELLLDPKGVFVFEVQYFPNLLFRNQFDNVYHEHRSFFALRPIVKLLEKAGMRVFDVKEVSTQGGSLRIFATHKNAPHKEEPIVARMVKDELDLGLAKKETYYGFQPRAEFVKMQLQRILTDLKKQKKRIVGYGAPAKGNTLLNFCGIGTQFLDYIIDETYFKHGKLTPGMHIPVYPSAKIEEDGIPDYYLLLVWNYAPVVLKQEEAFMKKGGKFIIPIPAPYIV